ncbi:Hypothetical protein R9X50_00792200 [Acrodontium crateriforme]|uniref:Required for respiratory growth protein 9, mitochondrial n=1 Tax=Acrodontium crateriforme TaxID=150365 RepID=A0AAQ3RB39_9PEZI|nr:Hypothetical protein R9X50_00792200 [Acrodontium crateriforme]
MRRKLRRIQAGTWQPSTKVQSNETEVVVEDIQTVLSKIEEMDGPSILRQIKNVAGSKSKSSTDSKNKTKSSMEKKSKDHNKREKTMDNKSGKSMVVPKREPWQEQKNALLHKFGEDGWQPRKRLSPDTLEGIRALHASDPASYTTQILSENFKISPEAIRRVLKSKWKPSDRELDDRKARWERRGIKKWQDMAGKGMRPPAKWRALGVGSEDGLKEDKVPKRKKKEEDGLAWDEVVKDIDVHGFSERIL